MLPLNIYYATKCKININFIMIKLQVKQLQCRLLGMTFYKCDCFVHHVHVVIVSHYHNIMINSDKFDNCELLHHHDQFPPRSYNWSGCFLNWSLLESQQLDCLFVLFIEIAFLNIVFVGFFRGDVMKLN